MNNRFRDRFRIVDGGRLSRCHVPRQLPLVLEDVDAGLAAFESFVVRLLVAEQSLFGNVGQNDSMRVLLAAMNTCFDWTRLATALPTAHDVHQFGVLAHGLGPFLKHTLWPPERDFPGVARGRAQPQNYIHRPTPDGFSWASCLRIDFCSVLAAFPLLSAPAPPPPLGAGGGSKANAAQIAVPTGPARVACRSGPAASVRVVDAAGAAPRRPPRVHLVAGHRLRRGARAMLPLGAALHVPLGRFSQVYAGEVRRCGSEMGSGEGDHLSGRRPAAEAVSARDPPAAQAEVLRLPTGAGADRRAPRAARQGVPRRPWQPGHGDSPMRERLRGAQAPSPSKPSPPKCPP